MGLPSARGLHRGLQPGRRQGRRLRHLAAQLNIELLAGAALLSAQGPHLSCSFLVRGVGSASGGEGRGGIGTREQNGAGLKPGQAQGGLGLAPNPVPYHLLCAHYLSRCKPFPFIKRAIHFHVEIFSNMEECVVQALPPLVPPGDTRAAGGPVSCPRLSLPPAAHRHGRS